MYTYINEHGRHCWAEVEPSDILTRVLFHTVTCPSEEDQQWAFHSNLGSITVLDRLTGFSGYVRDIETGFRDNENKFWLASGNFDIRDYIPLTIAEAIALIKARANSCNPDKDWPNA